MKIYSRWTRGEHYLSRRYYIAMIVERKSYRRVRNDLPVCLSPFTTMEHSLESFFVSPPFRLRSRSWHYHVHGVTDPVPVYPPEADSAERSETIKSTAESTLPCKLAHCAQAQRFTVTCIAYIYISSTHTFTTILLLTVIVHYLPRDITLLCYMVLYIYTISPYIRMCARALCKNHVNARRVFHIYYFSHPPRTHTRTPREVSQCHARNVRARTCVAWCWLAVS